MQVISIILNYALHSIPYGPPMNYVLCSPLLSHMPPMKLCPMTTMHPLPSYAYFVHDHPDILRYNNLTTPAPSNLRGLDKFDVRSNFDVLSPLEPQHP